MNIINKDNKSLPSITRGYVANLFAGAIVSALCLASATADDTEVFFGQPDPSKAASANVLFVLDTSGSMGWSDGSGIPGQTRLKTMKTALNTILDNTTNVNVGLMRFNTANKGGPILYPVSPIDKEICEGQDICGQTTSQAEIPIGDFDVQENAATGEINTGNTVLTMAGPSLTSASVPAGTPLTPDNSSAQTVGLYFSELDIPQGARIISATLDFTAAADSTPTGSLSSTEFSVRGELSTNAVSVQDNDYNLADRTRTDAEVTWSDSDSWDEGDSISSEPLDDVIQEIVDQAGWCGGNGATLFVKGTGLERLAYSREHSDALAPVLKFTYDSTAIPIGGGCAKKTLVSSVLTGTDDAEQRLDSNRVSTGFGDLDIPSWLNIVQQQVGVRFDNLYIPQGATILNANLVFEVRARSWLDSDIKLKIEGEASGDSQPFVNASYNTISGRTRTSADPVIWQNIPNPPAGQVVVSESVTPIAQEIVNRGDWNTGNAMTFILSKQSGSNFRIFQSYEGKQLGAPKIVIEYQAVKSPTSTPKVTVRDKLKEKLNAIIVSGLTPTLSTYIEGVNYFNGAAVDKGKSRYNTARLRVSDPASYTGGTVTVNSNCPSSDSDSHYCSNEKIIGDPIYTSPITDSCQTNFIVILSDGDATYEGLSQTEVQNRKEADTGNRSCTSIGISDCADDLASWIGTSDQLSSMPGKQTITTHTIGFNFSSPYLSSIAEHGGGKYYQASSSAQLVDAFADIISEAMSVDTNFVAPGATVNQFNRLTNRTDVYFSLFKPEGKPLWNGNLKRYAIGTVGDKVVIKDKYNLPAIDETTGFFSDGSKSWWNGNVLDGSSVKTGGAASQIEFNSLNARNLYTYVGAYDSIPSTGVDLTAGAQSLRKENSAITPSLLGIQDMAGSAYEKLKHRQDLLDWARGKDVLDSDEDGTTNDWRHFMGDAMHSQPALLSYANGEDPYTTIFVGTNEGYLHAIEHVEGQELYSFVPKELLQNFNVLWNNKSADDHPYGLDGAISTWHQDTNNNGLVDNNEKALLFTGMRRGGSSYYAIDVSSRLEPRLAWVIDQSVTGFHELGQTWSEMTPAKIMYEGEETDVLIFGAGYDTNQDKSEGPGMVRLDRTVDAVGRGLYIVEAETGDLLFSALGSAGGDIQFDDMEYSFAGNIRILDTDVDGLADQLYAADLGGQLWRFDFEKFHAAASAAPLLQGGVMADFSGDTQINERRFYYEPDVAIVSDAGRRFLSISIGSGWRAHPLDRISKDRFYMVKSPNVFKAPAGYGKTLDAGATYTPIVESDLVNVTNNIDATINEFGWMFELESVGEKVLGASVTADHKVFFTTYKPTATVSGLCSPAAGGGAFYALNILNGGPAIDLNNDGDITEDDRSEELTTSGLPPAPTPIIHDEKIAITTGLTTVDPDINRLTNRTFWVDETGAYD